MTRPVVTFDEAAHAYTVNGEPVPSVTQVITSVIGSGFEGIHDPAYYKQRGRAVHACGAFMAQGVEFECDPAIEGHVTGLRAFWRDVAPAVILYERAVGSRLYRFAGTPDLLAKANFSRFPMLFDYKSSMSEDRCRIQLGGYSLALLETTGQDIKHGFGVWLRGDGTYRMTKPFDLVRARGEFLALRTTYSIMELVGSQKLLEE